VFDLVQLALVHLAMSTRDLWMRSTDPGRLLLAFALLAPAMSGTASSTELTATQHQGPFCAVNGPGENAINQIDSIELARTSRETTGTNIRINKDGSYAVTATLPFNRIKQVRQGKLPLDQITKLQEALGEVCIIEENNNTSSESQDQRWEYRLTVKDQMQEETIRFDPESVNVPEDLKALADTIMQATSGEG
jgi:hypothetical protein